MARGAWLMHPLIEEHKDPIRAHCKELHHDGDLVVTSALLNR